MLYAQPGMSEDDRADTEMRVSLNVVEKESRLSSGLLLKIQSLYRPQLCTELFQELSHKLKSKEEAFQIRL